MTANPAGTKNIPADRLEWDDVRAMWHAIQWIASFLNALMYAMLALVLVRPATNAYRLALFVVATGLFTWAFHWLFVERPEELRKKLGLSRAERRAIQRELTQPGNWPPSSAKR
jgi:hypothetical protein